MHRCDGRLLQLPASPSLWGRSALRLTELLFLTEVMSCFGYQLGISCWTAVTTYFLSLYPDTPMSLLAKQNHCSMWSNWPTCSVMRVKFLKIAIFISAVALSASRSIIYGKKVASNWCELYAACVCAQSCQSLSVIDHHCFCVGVCPKLCVRMFKPLLPAMTACH